ncbi:MAG: hypothetical protein R3B13_16400 [Polyangiaceae bacterium]
MAEVPGCTHCTACTLRIVADGASCAACTLRIVACGVNVAVSALQ